MFVGPPVDNITDRYIAFEFGLPINSDIGTQGNAGALALHVNRNPLEVNVSYFIAWLLFAAATATDPTVRNQLISFVWSHASSNVTQGPFPSAYDVSTGQLSNSKSIARYFICFA